MITCTKLYTDIPFAHRQHNHTGHCRFIHGHNWSFEFTFGCNRLDSCGFVVDFGKLKWLREWLNHTFDHKLVLNKDDPFRGYLTQRLTLTDAGHVKHETSNSPPLYDFAEITVVPDASCEGLARWLFAEVHRKLEAEVEDREVWLTQVTVFEDSKNSATFRP